MAFPANFPDAHVRHWQDAELLARAGRWANADQLYGYSAECGLKAVMVANRMPVARNTGSPIKRRHRQHVQHLWGTFRSFVCGRPTAGLLHHLPQANPFAQWSESNRYAASHHFKAATVTPHRMGAHQVRQFYLRLRVSGHA